MSKKQKKLMTDLSHSQFVLPEMIPYLTRRQLLKTGVSMTGYLSAMHLLGSDALAQSAFAPARRLIWINMRGGWDILEVTDPKPSSTSGIDMSYSWADARELAGSDGVKIGRWLPNLAAHGEDVVVVRGLAMGTTSHMAGSVYMDTGVLSNAGRVNAASIPSVVASESQATIPIIQLGGGSDPQIDRGLRNPVSVVRAENLELYRSMYPSAGTEQTQRMMVLDYIKQSVDRLQSTVGTNDRLSAMAAAESKIRGQIEGNVAANLALSDADLTPFSDGAPTGLNQNLLQSFALTSKLIKNNLVTCVNLGVGGFDTHSNQETRLMPTLTGFDFILSRLIADLKANNSLDNTMIVVYSDFGRTPKVNRSNGRDHWPVGGALMIGGGIDGGRAVGGTDDDLIGVATNGETGIVDANGSQLNPTHLGGSILSLCLGSAYNFREGYLSPLAALTKLKAG